MLETSFYLLLAALLTVLGFGYAAALRRTGAPPGAVRAGLYRLYAGLLAWLAYTAILAAFGVFREFTLPPRIPLLLVLPAWAFIAWFFTRKQAVILLDAVPPWQAPALQGFRIFVEFLIYGVYLKGLGPVTATFEGYNFDILAGITGPLVALLVFRWRILPEKAAYYWNYFGLSTLACIVFIFFSLLLRPGLWGYAQTPIQPEFGTMPYLLIAGFFMPVAVFLHVFSILQGKRRKRPAAAGERN